MQFKKRKQEESVMLLTGLQNRKEPFCHESYHLSRTGAHFPD